LREQLGLVDQRDAGVDVEHVAPMAICASRPRHLIEVAVAQLQREALRPVGLIRSPMMQNGLSIADRDGPRP
jgi:hypothetical protein